MRARAVGQAAGFAPAFLSASSVSANEGGDFVFSVQVSEPCDITIAGGADANQFQLSNNLNTVEADGVMFSQTHASGGDNTREVQFLATSISTGLTASQTLTVTVLNVAAPAKTTDPVIEAVGNLCEGGAVHRTAASDWTSADEVQLQWLVGPTGNVNTELTDETSSTVTATINEVGLYIRLRETAIGPGGQTVAYSNTLGPIQSGILARVSFRSTDAHAVDQDRWAHVTAAHDTGSQVAVSPATGNPPNQTDTYLITMGGPAGAGSTSFSNTGGWTDWPELSGQANAASSWSVAIGGLPTNTPLKMKFGVGGNQTTETKEVRAEDYGGAGVLFTVSAVSTSLTAVLVPTGSGASPSFVEVERVDFAGYQGRYEFQTSSGVLALRRSTSGGRFSPRAIEITYPEFSQIVQGVGPYFIDYAAGDNADDGESAGTAWKNLPADPDAADGNVSVFTVDPGGVVHLKRGQHHRPAGFSRTEHVTVKKHGAAGNPITFDSDAAFGSGEAWLDGSEVLSSWTAASSGDVFANPNLANIEKHAVTGLTAFFEGQVHEAESTSAPAQFPQPHNPFDFNKDYAGSDAFLTISPAQTATQQFQGVTDSGGTGLRACWFEKPELVAHYGSVDITGWTICFYHVGRLVEVPITAYDTSTGRVSFNISNGSSLHTSSSDTWAHFCIRYHPFDLRTSEQFAVSLDRGTVFHHANNPANERSISRLGSLGVINKNYVTFRDLTLGRSVRRYGLTDRPIRNSGAITGLAFENVKIKQAVGAVADWALYTQDNISGLSVSNIEFEDNPWYGGISCSQGSNGTIDRLKIRNHGRTSILFVGSDVHDFTCTNIDASDNIDVHGNGISFYSSCHHITVDGYLAMSCNRPVTTDGINPTATPSRGLTVRRAVMTTPRPHPSRPWTDSDWAFIAWGHGAETDGLFEQFVFGFENVGFGVNGIADGANTGTIWRNGVFGDSFRCDPGSLVGVTMKNCYFATGSNVTSDASLTGTYGATNGGGNVYGQPSWAGVITDAMRKCLTAKDDGSGYQDVLLGHQDYPWKVPAWGATFSLDAAAYEVLATTTRFHRRQREGKAMCSLFGMAPDSSISLPAGVTDNDLFGLDRGQLYPLANLDVVAGSTLTITVRQANASPDNTGSTSRDTVIVFSFY